MGGFSRVALVSVRDMYEDPTNPGLHFVLMCAQVKLRTDSSRSFALKILKKRHILDTSQQDHILSERRIMMDAHNAFIIRSEYTRCLSTVHHTE